jgi:Domain of unknown function (DUF4185)
MTRIFQSLIQSDFGGGDHKNFEVLVIEGDVLAHWWRDNADPSRPWKRGQMIVAGGVAGAGAIIQSDFGGGDRKNFEVVVPLRAASGRVELWHFFHDNSDVNLPWQKAQRVTGEFDDVAGPASLIQSDFGGGDHKNFEVVAPLRAAGGRVELWHFFHDNSDVNLPWQRGQRITGDAADAAGPAALIQSDFGGGDHKNFEVVVPLRAESGRTELWHFFHDNSDVNLPWQRGQFVTDSLAGWASLIQSNFGSGTHKNFEVLAEECDESVVAYWHPNQDVTLPWLRDKPVIGRGYRVRLSDTQKIVQLTGEFDRQGWDGTGTPPPAHNQTETQFRVRGTDLGSSFVHKERTYFLFGDTWRVGQRPQDQDLDSIAFTTDTNADDGLDLLFLDRPPLIHPPVPQNTFNVPLDGVSVNESIFVFFSTDAHFPDGRPLMGRSILTRSNNDGFDFDLLYEFSRDRFINVSVERTTLDTLDAEQVGAGTRDVLCVWGSGRYRSSDVYLAILPMSELATGLGRRFYAGVDGAHAWSDDERDATPLFCAGCVGELSARWNPFLVRFLLTFNSDNPRGILLHAAPKPWGPWTHEPIMVFDPGFRAPNLDPFDPCLGDGYGKFMHVAWDAKRCDHLHDNMFGPPRENEWGGEYGPYQIAHMAKGSFSSSTQLFSETQLYFVMSTWNPYQVVLMTTWLSEAVLRHIE